MDTVAVGICQIRQGYDFEDNLSRAYGMIDDAAQKGAEIAVLPEMFFSPYEPVSIRSAAYLAERAAEGLRERAARHGIMIVAGLCPGEATAGGSSTARSSSAAAAKISINTTR
jgi:predicted amidohydrolase